MRNIGTTMIAVIALAAGLSAQHGKAESAGLTGTWNMGLQGGHVIPVALVLKQDGDSLTGVVSMPTQRIEAVRTPSRSRCCGPEDAINAQMIRPQTPPLASV